MVGEWRSLLQLREQVAGKGERGGSGNGGGEEVTAVEHQASFYKKRANGRGDGTTGARRWQGPVGRTEGRSVTPSFFLYLPAKILVCLELGAFDRGTCRQNIESEGLIRKILQGKELLGLIRSSFRVAKYHF